MRQRLNQLHRLMLVLSVGLVSAPLLAQAPAQIHGDPVFGVWILNLEKSVFLGRSKPVDQTRIYEPHPEGLKATVITTNPDGTETRTEYVAEYDGVEYPFRGGEEVDAIIMQREGPHTALATFTHAGMIVGNARRVISADGKEMTVTVRIRDNINSVAVFRKKEE